MGRRRLGIFGKRSENGSAEAPAPVERVASGGDDDFAPPEATAAELPAAPASEPEDWTVNGTARVPAAAATPAPESFNAEDGAPELPAPAPVAEEWLPPGEARAPQPAGASAPDDAGTDAARLEIEALEHDLEDAQRAAAQKQAALERRLAAAEARVTEAERGRAESDERLAALERSAREAAEHLAAAEQRLERERERLAERERDLERALAGAESRLAAERRAREEAEERMQRTDQQARELRAQMHRERERRLAEVEGALSAIHRRPERAEEPPLSLRGEGDREGAADELEGEPPHDADVGPIGDFELVEDAAALAAPEGSVRLSEAGFEELRALGMSVTQAKRVIRHRDAHGGFRSVDELDEVPGFPRIFLADLKRRLVP